MRRNILNIYRTAVLTLALMCVFTLVGCKSTPAASIQNSYGVPYKIEESRVGTSTGSPGEEMIEGLGIAYQSYNDSLDMMIALSDGKLDLAVTSRTEVNTFNRVNSIYAYSSGVEPLDYRFAVKKGNNELRNSIDNTLEAFKSDGTMAEVLSNWQRPEGQEYIYADIAELDQSAPVLKIAVSGMLEPMFFTDGGVQKGLNVELGKRVAYALGMRAEFIEMPISTLIAALESGKCDVAMTDMLFTTDRAKAVDFTSAYYSDVLVFVWIAGGVEEVALPEFTSLEQLDGRDIAVLTDSILDEDVAYSIYDVNYIYCSDLTAQLQMLSSGSADAVALDAPIAQRISTIMADVCVMPQQLSNCSYAYMLRHRSPLTKKVDAALDELWADGTVSALWLKWTGDNGNDATVESIELSGENGVIRFAFENAMPPMCYIKDGAPAGFEVELMMRVAQRLGMQLEFTASNFSIMERMLSENKADVAAGCITVTEERIEKYDMSQSTATGGTVLLVNNHVHVEQPGFFETIKNSFVNTFIAESRWKLILRGLVMTVLLSLASSVIGTVLGFLVCMAARSKNVRLSRVATGYIQILESTPLVVLLMILYYIVFKNSDIQAIVVAILAFSLNFSAYTAELMDSGIQSVDKGQLEAAQSLSLSKRQAFIKVVYPQAVRHSLEDYKRQFISLVEMTSVVGYVAIQDLTKVSDMIRSRTFEAFLPLISTAVIYFLIARALSKLLRIVEIRIDPDHRPRTKGLKGVQLEK